MDPFAPEGVLPNVLRWVSRPGQGVRNILRGNPAAAGRQVADFVGEGIDAFLPGDWIPAPTRKEDYISGSEFVGLSKDANPALRTATDIGVELATDPLSFLSFGLTGAAKAAAAAGKAVSKPIYGVSVGVPFLGRTERAIPGLDAFDAPVDPLSLAMRGTDTAIGGTLRSIDKMRQSPTVAGQQRSPLSKGYEALKGTIKRATAAEDLSPEVRERLQAAGGLNSQAARLYAQQAEDLFKGVPQDERVLVTKAYLGIDTGSLAPKASGKAVPLSGDLAMRIDTLARKYGKDPERMRKLAQGIEQIGERQWQEGLDAGVFAGQGTRGRDDYIQRQWILDNEGFAGKTKSSATANAEREAALKTPQDIANFFNKGNVGIELDAAKLLVDRAAQQGGMLERAQLAKQFGGNGTLADDLTKTALANIEDSVKTGALKADDGRRLAQALQGMPQREGWAKALAGANRVVKGAMVYGVVLPKIGSLVRNKISMGLTGLATPGVRYEGLKHLNPFKIVDEMTRAFDEAYGEVLYNSKSWARSDELGKDMTLIDDAFKNSKQTKDVAAYLKNAGRDDLADAVNSGVLDGFVSTEELVRKIANSPNKQVWWDLYKAPGIMFQTLEQRGRLQTFKDLRNKLGSERAPEAARLTKEAMFDYNISSPENRAFRDLIPFGQFMAKAIPQQAKWLSTKPAVAAAAAPLFYDSSGDEAPVYPYMANQSRVNIGEDTAGNNLYLTGFGLPMESINQIPNLSGGLAEAGRSVSQGLLSSTQPLLKTAGAIASGRDPFFGTPFGSYSKLPIVGDAGDVGRAVNVAAGTGILDPVGFGALRQIGNATDEGKPLAARALDIATGAKLVAVDSDIAERQTISKFLQARPDVQQYTTFYKNEDDPEFSQLMKELREAKARSKAKREAAALVQ